MGIGMAWGQEWGQDGNKEGDRMGKREGDGMGMRMGTGIRMGTGWGARGSRMGRVQAAAAGDEGPARSPLAQREAAAHFLPWVN